MTVLAEKCDVLAIDVACSKEALSVTLSDGRVVSAPLIWFPRLSQAKPRQRDQWELIGGGIGIHWEAIDEDICVAGLLQPGNFMRLPDTFAQPPKKRRLTSARHGARSEPAVSERRRATQR